MGAIKGLRVVLAALLCLVLGGSLWLTVQRQVFHQEELAVGGLILAPVEGDAMAPALRDGDMAVAVSRSGYEPPYSLGDAVLCVDGTFQRLVYQFLSSLWGPLVVLVVGVLLLALPSLFGLGREPAGAPAQEQPGKYRPRH